MKHYNKLLVLIFFCFSFAACNPFDLEIEEENKALSFVVMGLEANTINEIISESVDSIDNHQLVSIHWGDGSMVYTPAAPPKTSLIASKNENSKNEQKNREAFEEFKSHFLEEYKTTIPIVLNRDNLATMLASVSEKRVVIGNIFSEQHIYIYADALPSDLTDFSDKEIIYKAQKDAEKIKEKYSLTLNQLGKSEAIIYFNKLDLTNEILGEEIKRKATLYYRLLLNAFDISLLSLKQLNL